MTLLHLITSIPFVAGWLLLQFLFETFNIYLSAGFISIFLFVHAVIAIIIYEIFRTLLRGKLTRSAIKLRFNKSLLIAFLGNIVVLCLLSMIFRFDSIIVLSPIFLNVILFLSLRSSIPAGIKCRIKLQGQSAPIDSGDAPVIDPMDEILADLVDIRNPNGLINPTSPLYINRRHY